MLITEPSDLMSHLSITLPSQPNMLITQPSDLMSHSHLSTTLPSQPNMLITEPSDLMSHLSTTLPSQPNIPSDLMSHLYPDVHTHVVPQQGGEITKRRRRRKKSKPESGDGGSRKRKLSAEQVKLLEVHFGTDHKLDLERKDQLAKELRLEPRQVAVWFQNRRTRWRNSRLEEDYFNLKSLYDNTILDKCRVESEILKLKEQLSNAEQVFQRLSVSDRAGNCPSSSYSVDVTSIDQQPFFGDQFGMEGLSDVLYMPVVENYGYGVDQWINLYD